VTGCDHIQPELGGYVLDALEPDERDAVREHLARCSVCAAEHARLVGLPAILSLAERVEDAPPLHPAVEERVLDAVARERPRPAPRARRGLRRLRGRRTAWAAAAAGLAAVATVAVVLAVSGGGERRYEVRLQPVAGQEGAGRAELASAAGGTSVHLWVRDLPPDPNAVYEVRCEARNWSASAGTFRADRDGRAYVELTTAARREEYDTIRVVRRSRSTTTDVLTASLH
jgi:anti-sigma factor RsiW